ncbi:right-handed parallel beta-helix repeat-containing protein [Candidatus Woesearchaeota archaeon]|nr:right-handed parallel beta-helix repeat-containing protein [Candidatus Woesearchaeota archaeon]
MKKLWLLMLVFLVSVVNVYGVEVVGCRTIYDNSVLVGNITADRSPCITIGANDITLDCQGYTINGNSNAIGITAQNKQGFTIKNCKVSGFPEASLDFDYSNNSMILNNTFQNFGVGIASSGNLIKDNKVNGQSSIWGPSNTFEGNTFTLNSNNPALNIHADYNIIRNNVFTGGGDGFGIMNSYNANYNEYVNNTITYFGEGMSLGSYVAGANYNTVANNSFVDNIYGIEVIGGDLNSITGNDISSRNWTEADTTYEGWGIDLGGSRNNVLWGNTIHNQNNGLDVNLNLYCYQGIQNTWDFNITPSCEGDCIKPDCSEVLDNQGGWFNGGAALLNGMGYGPLAEVTGIVPRDDPIITAGWQSINYPDAIDGNTLYHTQSSGSDYVYWEVHSLLSRYDVYAWKFDHPWSPQMSTTAKYMIKHKYGLTTKYVDQSTPGDQWIYLGRYTFDDSELQGVAIFPSTGGIVAADAVKIISVS